MVSGPRGDTECGSSRPRCCDRNRHRASRACLSCSATVARRRTYTASWVSVGNVCPTDSGSAERYPKRPLPSPSRGSGAQITSSQVSMSAVTTAHQRSGPSLGHSSADTRRRSWHRTGRRSSQALAFQPSSRRNRKCGSGDYTSSFTRPPRRCLGRAARRRGRHLCAERYRTARGPRRHRNTAPHRSRDALQR